MWFSKPLVEKSPDCEPWVFAIARQGYVLANHFIEGALAEPTLFNQVTKLGGYLTLFHSRL